MNPELYTAAQGLNARQHQLDLIAHNIANVNTTGFKGTSPFFSAYNRALQEGPANPLNHVTNAQPVAGGHYTHFRQGALRQTGNPMDLGIQGEGFFKVQTPNGVKYTRAGHFTRSPQGTLVNANGYQVLSRGGSPIFVPQGEKLSIQKDGTILVDGNTINQVALVGFDDPSGLIPEEDTLFAHVNPNPGEKDAGGAMVQGHLESSNVNIAREMIHMISAQRAYELNTRAIRTIDRELNQAVIQGLGRSR